MIELTYDRSTRPLELWAAALASTRHPSTFTEDDLEAAIRIALEHCYEQATARVKCLAHYVLGRAILCLRDHYPDWREWVAHAAILASDWALESKDQLLIHRGEALFEEYVRLIK